MSESIEYKQLNKAIQTFWKRKTQLSATKYQWRRKHQNDNAYSSNLLARRSRWNCTTIPVVHGVLSHPIFGFGSNCMQIDASTTKSAPTTCSSYGSGGTVLERIETLTRIRWM